MVAVSKATQARKATRQAEMREKVLMSLNFNKLLKMQEELYLLGMEGKEDAEGNYDKTMPYRIGALKAAIDVHFRALAKILPDLKSMDMTLEDNRENLTREELEQQLILRGIKPEQIQERIEDEIH